MKQADEGTTVHAFLVVTAILDADLGNDYELCYRVQANSADHTKKLVEPLLGEHTISSIVDFGRLTSDQVGIVERLA